MDDIASPGISWKWIYPISRAAALGVGILFLFALESVAWTGLSWTTDSTWLSWFENNWLVVIFKLYAGYSEITPDRLNGWNLLDFTILVMVSVTYIGLFIALKKSNKILALLALVQPFLGIALFLFTETAGRSTVMGASLVISIAMLRSQRFDRRIAFMGIISSVLLLIADFSVGLAPSRLLAIVTGLGYIFLMFWYFLVAGRLTRKIFPKWAE